MISKTK